MTATNLQGKKILLGITGGIAAYKSLSLIRLLVRSGAEVRVVMTGQACQFVTPLTAATLSQNPVLREFADLHSGQWNSHVELGLWADLLLIAPLTANTMAKMASGAADNLLVTTYLAAKCPVMVFPSMDLDMYSHVATRRNVALLQGDGVQVVEAESGFLASGLTGCGRMPEPETILEKVSELFAKKKSLSGRRVLITAGPTYEAIDPVRFIGNHSSGKMGFALAREAAERGAEVILITGPTSQSISQAYQNIERIDVVSAAQMYDAAVSRFDRADIGILCAAVADFRPKVIAGEKIKKKEAGLTIEMEPTEDILAELGRRKKDGQTLVGFALETENETENALGKLRRKNLDMIVLNSLREKGAGFSTDTNKVTVFTCDGGVFPGQLAGKGQVAVEILDRICEICAETK